MKNKTLFASLLIILFYFVSCDEPETLVTNYVNTDGSVTRKIEMRNSKNSFIASGLKVPFDSSWKITDSVEISDKGDTTWVKRATKVFLNCEEINLAYKLDSGANKSVNRKAEFIKSFRWFNNVYRFSESIDKTMSLGYPVKDYLSNEELLYFYSPDSEKGSKQNGPDSLKFRAMEDSVSKKTDKWIMKSAVSEWIGEFSILASGKDGIKVVIDSLRQNEDALVTVLNSTENDFDSLWASGAILKPYIGESGYRKFKIEADSAIENVIKHVMPDFKNYSLRISMPGKLTGSNGFVDSSQILMWPVKSDYFLTEPYIMWAESKVPNRWAWVVSALFLLFVLTGVLIRVIKKKG